MGTARVKQEEETGRITVRHLEESNVGTNGGESPKQGLTSAKNLTIKLLGGRDSPYHILD